MPGFLEHLREIRPEERWETLDSGAAARLEKFAAASPLYARLIEQDPALARWLESPESRQRRLHRTDLARALQHAQAALAAEPPPPVGAGKATRSPADPAAGIAERSESGSTSTSR